MKKILIISTFLFFVASLVFSQSSYQSAVGLRLGYPNSVSYKQFVSNNNAAEIYAGFRSWSSSISSFFGGALYEIHKPIQSIDGLQWYYGGGISVYLWNYASSYNNQYGNFNLGIGGCVGFDYTLRRAPINISLDWVPNYIIGNSYYGGIRGDAGGLSVRYTIN